MMQRQELSEIKDNKALYNTFELKQDIDESQAHEYLLSLLAQFEKRQIKSNESDEIYLRHILLLSNEVLLYKLVEIRKMILESGCFKFEDREENCLEAFFTGYGKSFKQKKFTVKELKELHAINTNPKVVKMKMEAEQSGEFRNGSDTLQVPFSMISDAGITYLIDLIAADKLKGLKIGGHQDYEHNKDIAKLKQNAFDLNYKSAVLDKIIAKTRGKDPKFDQKELKLVDNICVDMIEQMDYEVYASFIPSYHKEPIDKELINKKLHEYKTDLLSAITTDEVFAAFQKLSDDHVCLDIMSALSARYDEDALDLFNEAVTINKSVVNSENIKDCQVEHHAKSHYELALSLIERWKGTEQHLLIEFVDYRVIDRLVKEIFNEIQTQLETYKEKTVEEKLSFIYHYMQILLLIHPFADANNRTILNQYGSYLHRELNLPEPIFYNPFFPYALSPSEVLEIGKLSCALGLATEDQVAQEHKQYFKFWSPQPMDAEKVAKFVAPIKNAAATLLALKVITNRLNNYIEELSQESTTSNVEEVYFKQQTHCKLDQIKEITKNIVELSQCDSVDELELRLIEMRGNLTFSTGKLANLYNELAQEISTQYKPLVSTAIDNKGSHLSNV